MGREGSEYVGVHKVEDVLELLPHDSETVFVQVPAQGCIGKEGIQRGEELQDLGVTAETKRHRRRERRNGLGERCELRTLNRIFITRFGLRQLTRSIRLR